MRLVVDKDADALGQALGGGHNGLRRKMQTCQAVEEEAYVLGRGGGNECVGQWRRRWTCWAMHEEV